MDFSSDNPNTSNSLNLAARNNDVEAVRRLLKQINPNCVDNRGWTCLHEAADSDSFKCLKVILNDPKCRPLAETHEGHTALYLACRRKCSMPTIKALLDKVEDIANYGSTENVTPLHVASSQGRLELMQLLIEYGALIDVEDFDGDTPLHDAALISHEAVNLLLHAGANPDIKNSNLFTPFHMTCTRGCYETIKTIYPFISDINQLAMGDETPLMLAVRSSSSKEVIQFLLDNGADMRLRNESGQTVLDIALTLGFESIFKFFLAKFPKSDINFNIILQACKPHYFKFEILEALLYYDLGPEFFDFIEPFHVFLEEIGGLRPEYLTNAPLNSYLNICEYIYTQSPEKFREFFYLFLMRGVSVNAQNINECPPLVYIHYSMHSASFVEVFKILRENGCNIDYCSSATCPGKDKCVPDVFIASLSSDPETMPIMMQYSLRCEPQGLLKFAFDNGFSNRMSLSVQQKLILMIEDSWDGVTPENIIYYVPPLRHFCRLKIRSVLKRRGLVKSTKDFISVVKSLPIPVALKAYLHYF